MKKIINATLAGKILLVVLSLLMLLHILILSGLLPHDFIWGGRAIDQSTMQGLEVSALVITFLFIVITSQKINDLKTGKRRVPVNIGMWLMFAYFIFNIFGNLTSSSQIEMIIFIPVSFILALSSLRLAIEK